MTAARGRPRPTCLFVDIGGVLLTNGWDRRSRRRAAAHFRLDLADFEERHRTVVATCEEGRMTLSEYLGLVVFHQKRPFTRAAFRRFMFAESQPYPDMLALVARLKATYGLKVVAVSNEARELNAHRIRTFGLDRLVDTFVSSCFVQRRKPDAAIFRLALDLASTPPGQVIYLENTALFVDIATGLGIRSVLHRDVAATRTALAAVGLPDPAARPSAVRL